MRKTSPEHPAHLDIVCFSEHRSDLAPGARLRELLSRACHGGARVLVIEPPVWRSGGSHVETTTLADGIRVATPILTAGLPGYLTRATARRTAHQAVVRADLGPYALWCSTPLAVSFGEQLTPTVVLYDRAGDPAAGNCPEKAGRDRELLTRADLVLARNESELDAALRVRPDAHLLSDATSPAEWDERWSAARRLMEHAHTPRLAPAA